eukprot:941508-Pleurochrysis_carterae.AAC.1
MAPRPRLPTRLLLQPERPRALPAPGHDPPPEPCSPDVLVVSPTPRLAELANAESLSSLIAAALG